MASCRCSILDVRQDKVLENNGRSWVQLVCNVCGAVLDSKEMDADSQQGYLPVGNQTKNDKRTN